MVAVVGLIVDIPTKSFLVPDDKLQYAYGLVEQAHSDACSRLATS